VAVFVSHKQANDIHAVLLKHCNLAGGRPAIRSFRWQDAKRYHQPLVQQRGAGPRGVPQRGRVIL
jgi:hypothetical protein